MIRNSPPQTAYQAVFGSNELQSIAVKAMESKERLRSVKPLLPATLHSSVEAGPIEGSTWCLIMKSSAAAAKIRQLIPSMQAHLRSKGWDVETIRLRIATDV